MCELCHHYPCHPSCPNAAPSDLFCEKCGYAFYVDDSAYKVGGVYYCEDCMDNMKLTIEPPPSIDEDRLYDEWRERQDGLI